MKVQLFVSKDLEEPYAEIYTDVLTDNIQKAMVLLENETEEEEEGTADNSILAVKKGQDIVHLCLSSGISGTGLVSTGLPSSPAISITNRYGFLVFLSFSTV